MPYIGTCEIADEVQEGDFIRVNFKKNPDESQVPSALVSQKVLDEAKTDEPNDEKDLRDHRCEIVAEEVMEVFLRHNIHIDPAVGDMNRISSMLMNMLNNCIDEAQQERWGVHPYNMDIQSIEKELQKKAARLAAEKEES